MSRPGAPPPRPHDALARALRAAVPGQADAIVAAALSDRSPWELVAALRHDPALLEPHAAAICASVLDAAAAMSRARWGGRASLLLLRADADGFVAWAFGADGRAEAGGVAVGASDASGFVEIARAERCLTCGGGDPDCGVCELGVSHWRGTPRRGLVPARRQLARR